MAFLFWSAVVLLSLLAACLLLPVRVLASLRSDPTPRATIQLALLGGGLPLLQVYDSARRSTEPEVDEPATKSMRKGRRHKGRSQRIVLAEMSRFVRRLIAAIRLEALQVDAEFGLGDPAETGQLYGQLTPLIYGTGGFVRLRPNFETACLHGSGVAQFRFVPIVLISPFIGFGWRVFGPFR